ncbi:unnamed protein product [Soboliphyme baturini]|uniref:Metalloendopeptidase n=1 Tax=Soboliphyme baturini TaxID=241478 RepID=A0A183IPD5_9BILA|nr:unnamed protein product [Soboliphyme baturini]
MAVSAHELGHALGLWHEQSRPDAGNYITVVPENIMKGQLHNFLTRSPEQLLNLSIPYDLGSVMHYGPTAFSIHYELRTIETVEPAYQRTIGQREQPSFLDVKTINRAYCEGIRPFECINGGYVHPRHCDRCLCPSGLAGTFCEENEKWPSQQCGEVIQVKPFPQYTVIQNPSYPRQDKAPTKCSWLLEADTGSRISMEFIETFAFLCEPTCRDYVEVKNNSNLVQTGMSLNDFDAECAFSSCCAPYKPDGSRCIKSHGTDDDIYLQVGQSEMQQQEAIALDITAAYFIISSILT